MSGKCVWTVVALYFFGQSLFSFDVSHVVVFLKSSVSAGQSNVTDVTVWRPAFVVDLLGVWHVGVTIICLTKNFSIEWKLYWKPKCCFLEFVKSSLHFQISGISGFKMPNWFHMSVCSWILRWEACADFEWKTQNSSYYFYSFWHPNIHRRAML